VDRTKHRVLRLISTTLLLNAFGIWCKASAEEEPPQLKVETVLASKHARSIQSLSFSPDGKKLLAGEIKGRMLLWDLGKKKSIVLEHHQWIAAGIFDYDGKRVATAGSDGEITLWEGTDGKKITSLVGDTFASALFFSSDGKELSAAVGGELHFWDLEKRARLRTRKIVESPVHTPLHVVKVSATSKNPLLGYGSLLYDGASGDLSYRCIGKIENAIACSAITSDEKRMATGGDGAVMFWKLSFSPWDRGTAERIATLKHPRVHIHSLAFSPDNKILAAGYERDHRETGRYWVGGVFIFALPGGKLLANQDVRIVAVRSLAFSPDGSLLATGDASGLITLWSIPDAWRKKKDK
jgi:WD40 repeat protein